MAKKRTVKASESATADSQLAKFKETAKQVETDNSVENFDKALKKIAGTTGGKRREASR
jgi:ribosomal protein L11